MRTASQRDIPFSTSPACGCSSGFVSVRVSRFPCPAWDLLTASSGFRARGSARPFHAYAVCSALDPHQSGDSCYPSGFLVAQGGVRSLRAAATGRLGRCCTIFAGLSTLPWSAGQGWLVIMLLLSSVERRLCPLSLAGLAESLSYRDGAS